MATHRAPPFACRGSSFIELLVAAALTAMLLVGVIAIFLSWRSSSETADHISATQEAGQRAIETLASAIRSADFPGCTSAPSHSSSSVAATDDPRWNFADAALRGYPSAGQSEMLPYVTNAASDSEVLFVRGIRNTEPMQLASAMETSSDPLQLDSSARQLQAGDVAMIYSCAARVFFTVTQASAGVVEHDAPDNESASLGYVFGTEAEILPVSAALFYVGPGSNNARSLWRRSGDSAPEEIVRGIETMRLQYGIDADLDGTVDEYRAAADVSDWHSVVSVSIELRVRSTDTPPDTSRAVSAGSLADEVQSFSTIVALRNPPFAG